MPVQQVTFTDQQAEFVRQEIDQGRFHDASEVVRAGLRLLQQQEELDRVKLDHLRHLVQEGMDAIDRGEFETITENSLDQFIDSIRSTSRQAARP